MRHAWAFAAVAAFGLAACATTTLRDSWADPSVRAEPFRKVLVVSVGGGIAQRRIFEDALAVRLDASGVAGVQGYRFLPDGKATESEMDAAVAQAGADGLMLVHFRGVRTETEVRATMVPGMMAPGWGPGWYGWYGGFFAVPEVVQTRIATVETSLFDVRTKRLAWTGVTETFDPSSFRKEAGALADVIVAGIATHGLVPKGRS